MDKQLETLSKLESLQRIQTQEKMEERVALLEEGLQTLSNALNKLSTSISLLQGDILNLSQQKSEEVSLQEVK